MTWRIGHDAVVLEVFGLSGDQEEVYLALLDLPPVTVAEAHRACPGLARGEIRAVLEQLSHDGLLSRWTTARTGTPLVRQRPP